MYAIIHQTDSDGPSVDFVTKEELLKRITPDKDGYTYYGSDSKIATTFPKNFDNYSHGLVLLKVELVVPKTKTTITEFVLD